MGLEHGLYCLGCCWLFFVIVFPLGMMNVAVLAAIVLIIFAEKSLPFGHRVKQPAGDSSVPTSARPDLLRARPDGIYVETSPTRRSARGVPGWWSLQGDRLVLGLRATDPATPGRWLPSRDRLVARK